ncbi:MAG: SDR family NAD(P)-dependent oxidoreductase [Hyphomicrobiaceae bacterium]
MCAADTVCEPWLPVALVTGAASGIGAATVRAIASRCRGIAVHARGSRPDSRDGLDRVAAEAREAGADVLVLHGDLAEPGAARRLVESTIGHFGGLDQVVANAGFADRRGTAELTRLDLDRSLATMAGAFLELAQAATPALRASPHGRVVYLSSFVAHRFVPGGLFPASAAAKAAGEALMRTLAAELAPAGVTVNAVVPGYTRKDGGHTALNPDAWKAAAAATPLGRIAEPADIAALVAFLLSPAARHITGQAIAVDGGLSLG